MKEAIVYFEGKEVERVYFEKMDNIEGFSFFIGRNLAAYFPKGYAFVVIKNDIFSITVNPNDLI